MYGGVSEVILGFLKRKACFEILRAPRQSEFSVEGGRYRIFYLPELNFNNFYSGSAKDYISAIGSILSFLRAGILFTVTVKFR